MSNVYEPKRLQQANRWRSQYNPLRGLTMARVVSLLEQGERGSYANLQWLYRYIEKRDATVRALKRLRLEALKNKPWRIETVDPDNLPPGATDAMAEKQAQHLRELYEGIGNLTRAIEFLGLAEFRGFAHLERHYDKDGRLIHLEPVPQWHWFRDGIYGVWRYDPESRGFIAGTVPIDPTQFVIREVEDPIDEIALRLFVRKALGEKDHDGFIEVFGIPPTFAEMPPDTPPEKEDEYMAMAEAVIGDMRGVLPSGAKIHHPGSEARGTEPFSDYLRRIDEQIVLAGTSGKLTMLAESGSGTLAGGAHSETFDELAEGEAKSVAEVFREFIDEPELEAAFPGQPHLAYLVIGEPDSEDADALVDRSVKLEGAGIAVDVEDLGDRIGQKLERKAAARPPGEPEDPEEAGEGLPTSNEPPSRERARNRARARREEEGFLRSAADELAEALRTSYRPLAERLAELLALADAEDVSDEELAQMLEDFRDQALPDLFETLAEQDQVAATFERILGAATADGLAGGPPSRGSGVANGGGDAG